MRLKERLRRFEDRGYAIETFERHNEEVKRRVPPENLLVYEVGEGWAPLCEFLGVEVPDEPFPHLNNSEVFRGRIRRLRVLTSVALAIGVSLVGLVLVRFHWRRRHRGPPGALQRVAVALTHARHAYASG